MISFQSNGAVVSSGAEMETVRGAFHAQVASVMDTLLAAAVCEIAKIFESSLREHQAELLEKTEEICVLRSELEKVERRCAESAMKGLDAEKQMSESEHGVKLEPDPVNISDDALCQNCENPTGIKKEADFLDEADDSKHEQNGSQSSQGLAIIQDSEMLLAINQQEPPSSTQSKDETSHWDQSNLTAAQLHEEDVPSPSLSVSPKVRSHTSRTEGWLPKLNSPKESTIENLQSDEHVWSGPPNRHTVFEVDETISEDVNGSILNQEPENTSSSHGIESEQRREEGLKNHPRPGLTFKSRDRPQSNFHVLALRNMDCLSHRPAGSGATGRPYTCPYCAKCFAYPSHQRRHLLRHTGVRMHSCQFCDKRFLTASELTVHTRTHTGERPFGCGQCGKRFTRSGNLRAHQRDVHLGKRPFACTECGKRFAHKGNLRVHYHRVHQGQRFFLQEQFHIDSDAV